MIKYTEADPITSWNAFSRFARHFKSKKNWIFRGQSTWSWPLSTNLERLARDYDIDADKLPNIEQGLIRKFKRHYSHFAKHVPDDRDYMEWLSIMQHYGAPTRLLDFTYSIFVALYFAVIDSKMQHKSAIWCIDSDWINRKYANNTKTNYKQIIKNDKALRYLESNIVVLNDKITSVYCPSAFHLNRRLTVQQGTFIMPTNSTKPFMRNLNEMLTIPSESSKILKAKLVLNKSFFEEALYNLYRMNITTASLFPGIIGFAKYLRMLTKIPNTIMSATDIFL